MGDWGLQNAPAGAFCNPQPLLLERIRKICKICVYLCPNWNFKRSQPYWATSLFRKNIAGLGGVGSGARPTLYTNMTTFVEIAVNIPQVSGVFHYHLPPELEGLVGDGCLVTVPFGKQTVQGIVLRIVDDPTVPQTKPVLELLDPEPVVTQSQINLARHLSENSLTPLAACISLMLPPGLSQMADTLYRVAGSGKQESDAQSKSP